MTPSLFLITDASSVLFVNTVFPALLMKKKEKKEKPQINSVVKLKKLEPKSETENFRCRPQFCPIVTKMDKMSDYL